MLGCSKLLKGLVYSLLEPASGFGAAVGLVYDMKKMCAAVKIGT